MKNHGTFFTLKGYILLCLFLLVQSCLFADNGKFKSLSVSAGLAHTDVTCFAQDSTGLIWIGTNAGVQSYDGYSFTTYDYYGPLQKTYNSHNRINSMSCSRNLLWVGSESGLTCIDMNTRLYKPYTIKGNSMEVQYKRVTHVEFDAASHCLWILTDEYCYVAVVDETDDSLSLLEWEAPVESRVSGWKVTCKDGILWKLDRNRLTSLFVENGKVKASHYNYKEEIEGFTESAEQLAVTSHFLYLRTGYGCYKIPFKEHSKLDFASSSYLSFHGIHQDIPEKTAGYLMVDENTGDLWCAYWAGLFCVNHPFTSEATVSTYFRNTENMSLSKVNITSLLLDCYGNLWVGMSSWGLYFKSLYPLPFYQVPKEKFLEKGYSRSEVVAVDRQEPDIVWMIIESGSLFRYDEKKKELSLVPLDINKGIPDAFQSLYLSANQKYLYIGLSVGLVRYEIATGKTFWMIGKYSSALPEWVSVTQMGEDRQGRLWVGTWYTGIYCFDNPETTPSLAYHYTDYIEPALSCKQVSDVCIGKNFVLVATTNGLNKIVMDRQGNVVKIVSCQVNAIREGTMSSNHIASVDIENDSVYWAGTIGGGLNKIVLHSDENDDYTAEVYTSRDGMAGNDAEIVFRDYAGNVWTGGNGISYLDTRTGKITAYGAIDGLQKGAFKMGVRCRATDGTIYMGGPEGLNYFQPKHFGTFQDSVRLVFSNFYINNEVMLPGNKYEGQVILQKTLDRTETLQLAYNRNAFSISFSALGYQMSNRIVYRYRMSGYDKEWHQLPYLQNRIYYTNVPSGKYTLEVQVSTDYGETWKQPGRSLGIEVGSPLWLRWWAKLFYILAFAGIAAIILCQYNKEQRLRRENHIQELLRKKDEEKYQSKMIFFMNLSHELKTPLSLIMLAAERIGIKQFPEEVKMIMSNARKMLQLIAEMVEIRKTELGINELAVTTLDMAAMTKQICREMTCLAAEKKVEMTFASSEATLWINADRDKIGKMLVNICSNAVKYTPEGGKIEIELKKGNWKQVSPLYRDVHREGVVSEEEELCLLTVRDSGIGISSESISHIYERFFQVKGEESSHLGSGIGLAIVKNVVLLHQGTILVSSRRGEGTEIIVALPIKRSSDRLQKDTLSFDARDFIENQNTDYKPIEETMSAPVLDAGAMNPELPILLIVEDNREMQHVLYEHFSPLYNVRIAENGREGLSLCESVMPDIIVSDVMMPEMDGVEMCRLIRNNLSIAYLPVVLLTAKGEVEDQIEGYESGADLYISKPFSMRLLEVNLKQLLEKKRLVFSRTTDCHPVESESVELENVSRRSLLEEEKEVFRSRLHQLIEENLSNSELSVEFFCQQLFMGKTKLWQRVKECCGGESLAEYVRNVRLDKAAALLRESTLNITEVRYEVGYTNSSHFARAFKQKFGVSPSDYIKNSCNESNIE